VRLVTIFTSRDRPAFTTGALRLTSCEIEDDDSFIDRLSTNATGIIANSGLVPVDSGRN